MTHQGLTKTVFLGITNQEQYGFHRRLLAQNYEIPYCAAGMGGVEGSAVS